MVLSFYFIREFVIEEVGVGLGFLIFLRCKKTKIQECYCDDILGKMSV